MKRVYFIKPIGFDGPIKIGNSCDPSARREQLSLWSPFPLEIVAELDGDLMMERRFHAKFRDDHRGHEWFTATDELLATVAAIAAGTFDVATLPQPMSLAKGKPKPGNRTWSVERRASHARQVAVRRAEKASGLKYNGGWDGGRVERFIANPCAENGGIPIAVWQRRNAAWLSKYGPAKYRKPADASSDRVAA